MCTNLRDCPNATHVKNGIRCEVLAPYGIRVVTKETCINCRPQWIDGQPPTAESSLTPVMNELLDLFGLVETTTTEPPRQPCYHLGRVISRPCNCPMKFSHQCELLGRPVSRGTDCRTCESWESEA